MKAHPAAALFPMMTTAELDRLAADIKENGQAQPIIIWRESILDGRNRAEACGRIGREPDAKDLSELSERDAVRLVISCNINRRHLSESERASIANALAALTDGQHQGAPIGAPTLTQQEAADAMNVSRRSVQRVRAVKASSPDLAERVAKGEITINKAVQLSQQRSQRRAKAETNPDLADDAVVDAAEERAAEGDTMKARAVLAAVSRLDPTELSFIKPDLLKMLGIA